MTSTAKAKTAKLSTSGICYLNSSPKSSIVRTLLDFFNSIPDSRETQTKVLQDNIEWARSEKRIFLKHSLEIRLVGLYVHF